jgi:hypothetical protein
MDQQFQEEEEEEEINKIFSCLSNILSTNENPTAKKISIENKKKNSSDHLNKLLNSEYADAKLFDFNKDIFNSNENKFIETSTPTDEHMQELEKPINEEYYFKEISNKSTNKNKKFNFDDYVCIKNAKNGRIKYIGKVHFANGLFCGIELDEPIGKHDGKIENIR